MELRLPEALAPVARQAHGGEILAVVAAAEEQRRAVVDLVLDQAVTAICTLPSLGREDLGSHLLGHVADLAAPRQEVEGRREDSPRGLPAVLQGLRRGLLGKVGEEGQARRVLGVHSVQHEVSPTPLDG
jgi:hypothetical protein